MKQSAYPVEQFHLHSLQTGTTLVTTNADVPNHLFYFYLNDIIGGN